MPMRCGSSGSVTAVKPALGVAADLRGALLGVGEVRDAHRDDAVGVRLSTTRRRTSRSTRVVTARPSSGSEHCENTAPQKPVICDGKFTDAHTPLMSMSLTRASMS